jgi:sarcosine oxidase subunit alpha
MTGYRVDSGGRIDRSHRVRFNFDGNWFEGHPGDTLVSALLANGVRVMGRSFKYHRPRGAWSGWTDEPNAIFDVRKGGNAIPNLAGATTPLEDGMLVRAVNATPSARIDVKGVLDLAHGILGAGFYYKTFMQPDWHLFEPWIRRVAGLGRLDLSEIAGYESDRRHDVCDLLVIGGGAAGLTAARAAAEAGQDVVLVEDHPYPGGGALQLDSLEGRDPSEWAVEMVAAIRRAGGRVLLGATAFGIYDHQLVAIVEAQGFAKAPGLIRMRAARCLLASGAIDRPVTFAMNDRPGVMSLNGAADLLARYAVLPGQRIAVVAPHGAARSQAETLSRAGAVLDWVEPGAEPMEALGRRGVTALKLGGKRLDCDAILTSAGLAPLLHLWRHTGGKLTWDENVAAFLPAEGPDWLSVIGAAAGTFDIEGALEEARAVALGNPRPDRTNTYEARPPAPRLKARKRQWIDFQNDVTVKDLEQAAQENFVSVEHLKRYTTLGMAPDQGKTSNVAGLLAMAAITGRSVSQTGTTTFRPPFTPIPFELYRGSRRGEQFDPVKRLPLEGRHRALGAALGEYGGWLRPAWYGTAGDAIQREAAKARTAAGVFDASPLGKIEVIGPDATAFLNFVYYNTMATLKPGAIRYGFMLTEGGHVFDDGVLARLDEHRFVVSCSSSHVDAVAEHLEAWRQDGWDPDRVFVHDTTESLPTVTVTGPAARRIVATLGLGLDLSVDAFPHMAVREGRFDGAPARVARVSFTGDASFEISVPVAKVGALWDAVLSATEAEGGGPVGLEALSILRAEKGFVIVGKDTDGETMPQDLGIEAPRSKKTAAFIGDRSLRATIGDPATRRRFVGFEVTDGKGPLPVGAHVVNSCNGKPRSCGFVSSSYLSPTLGRPIALGLVEAAVASEGADVELFHLGASRHARIVPACFLDPEGTRLNA